MVSGGWPPSQILSLSVSPLCFLSVQAKHHAKPRLKGTERGRENSVLVMKGEPWRPTVISFSLDRRTGPRMPDLTEPWRLLAALCCLAGRLCTAGYQPCLTCIGLISLPRAGLHLDEPLGGAILQEAALGKIIKSTKFTHE